MINKPNIDPQWLRDNPEEASKELENWLGQLQEENEDLENSIDVMVATIHGLNSEHRLYFKECQERMDKEEFGDMWRRGRAAFREGKAKWSPDES